MNQAEVIARQRWIKLYEETQDAGLTCRRCGISRPTLRKWYGRYQKAGLAGLQSQSRRPKNSPNIKLSSELKKQILDLRNSRNLGARRIQSELVRLFNIHLSLATIHKVLSISAVMPIKKLKRKKQYKRYSRPIPGDRIQVDTCKIKPGIYQYTAVDDCTRWRVLQIYKRRTAKNTLKFIDKVVEEFPFPIQRIQSDRGQEFFAYDVQEKLMAYGIKFRPIKPRSPHLNGKVERSQKTDLEEFYATVDLDDFGVLREELECWQFYYNWQRPHGSLNGKTPSQVDSSLADKTPFQDEVCEAYDEDKEHVQMQSYYQEMQFRKLKRCL